VSTCIYPLQFRSVLLYTSCLLVSKHFSDWIAQQIVKRFSTATALAKALDMHLSAFVRGVTRGTFAIATLLRLARLTDTHPSTVLRLADKGDVADLIEDLYQIEVNLESLSNSEHQLIKRWRELSPRAQRSLEIIMAELPPRRKENPRRSAVNA
jgi:hypothetical protein